MTLIQRNFLSIMLMLLVFTGQVLAADGINLCDMNIHQISADHNDTVQSDMDRCNDITNCAMDCSLSMVSMLSSNIQFEANHISTDKINSLKYSTAARSFTSLFRPPISA